jgi:hypothetical protein
MSGAENPLLALVLLGLAFGPVSASATATYASPSRRQLRNLAKRAARGVWGQSGASFSIGNLKEKVEQAEAAAKAGNK